MAHPKANDPLGVWMNINNPNRSTHEDLNLTVGGTVLLSSSDPHGLWTIRVRVMDEDTFSDDLVFTDDSFQLGVFDPQPRFFQTGVIVPYQKLNASEPSYEGEAEIYCRVSAKLGNKSTNWRNSQTEDVKIH
jgi:hypothetical protein